MSAQGSRIHTGSRTDQNAASSSGRQAGLERLRIVATLLVVWLHATIAYIAIPLPGLAWPVHEASNSWLINVSFWFIQSSIMPLFFVLSGIAAFHLWSKKSPIEFLKHRLFRLGGPLLAGTILVLPFDMYLWAIGWVVTGRYEPVKLKSLKFSDADSQMFFGFAHLWYLVALFIISALACLAMVSQQRVVTWWRSRRDIEGVLRFPSQRHRVWKSTLLAITFMGLAVGFFYLSPRMTLGFKHGFEPHVTHVAYYAIFFATGWWMTTSQLRLSHPWVFCILALAMFVPAYASSHQYLSSGEMDHASYVASSALIPMTAVLTVAAAIGWALKSQRELTPRETYLSQMSLWIYLAHHPLVGGMQTLLYFVTLPVILKAVCAMAVSVTFCALSYRWVRRGMIAKLMYGRNMPSLAEIEAANVQITETIRRAA